MIPKPLSAKRASLILINFINEFMRDDFETHWLLKTKVVR